MASHGDMTYNLLPDHSPLLWFSDGIPPGFSPGIFHELFFFSFASSRPCVHATGYAFFFGAVTQKMRTQSIMTFANLPCDRCCCIRFDCSFYFWVFTVKLAISNFDTPLVISCLPEF